MKFYMLRNKADGLYYKRSNGYGDFWVPQEEASVWTTPRGPQAAKGNLSRKARRGKTPDVEIMEFDATKPRVVFVDGDDWEGLYLNGKLVEEGHHIHLDNLFKHVGIDGDVIIPDQDWLEARGHLPMDLAEVREE